MVIRHFDHLWSHVKKKVVYYFKFYAYIFTDMVSLFVFKSEKYFLLPK